MTDWDVIPPIEVIDKISLILSESREKLGPRIAILVANTIRYGKARQLGALLEHDGILSQPFFERKTAAEWLQAGMDMS